MAEYVHQTLEEMIPELEEMNRIGLFSVKETKIILKNRESHEYKLRQVTKTKSAFLNYIEYEKKLLELLKIRRKKLGQDNRKRDVEKSIADRIHKLYRLLTTRFPEDVALWEQHIDFSTTMNEKAYVTRLYNQVLKIHSHNEELWVKSAQWESSLDGNSNTELAREILLKGQRVNPESQPIFIQMYLMELEVAKQIVKRKSVLGISTKEKKTESMEEEVDEEEEEGTEWKLAEILYRKGMEMFAGNPEFHLKMLNICCYFSDARKLQNMIAEDLKRLYPETPSVWNGLALRYLNNIKKLSTAHHKAAISKCLDVFTEAVEKVPTEEMWSLCLRAHLNILYLREAKAADCVIKPTLTMFEKALQLGTLSEDLYMALLDLLDELGMTADLERVAARGTEQHPKSSSLWLARLRVMEVGEGEEIEKTLKASLKRVPAEESWPLWQFVLNTYALKELSGLEELMEQACRSITPQVCKPAKEWCLHWTYKQGGIKKARNIYNNLKNMRPISLQLYRLYVQLETSQLEPSLQKIRAAFEEALVEFGQREPDLWLNYMEMERDVAQDVSRSGLVQDRALNSLDSHLKESFIRKQVMLGLNAQ